jgi:hypothetical protein
MDHDARFAEALALHELEMELGLDELYEYYYLASQNDSRYGKEMQEYVQTVDNLSTATDLADVLSGVVSDTILGPAMTQQMMEIFSLSYTEENLEDISRMLVL